MMDFFFIACVQSLHDTISQFTSMDYAYKEYWVSKMVVTFKNYLHGKGICDAMATDGIPQF